MWLAFKVGALSAAHDSSAVLKNFLTQSACFGSCGWLHRVHQNVLFVILCLHCYCFQVQKLLGCSNALAFDLTAACSGFVLGLVTATRFIRGISFT